MMDLEIINKALRGLINGHQEREENTQVTMCLMKDKADNQATFIRELEDDLQKSDRVIDDLAEKLDNANSLVEELQTIITENERVGVAVLKERDHLLEVLKAKGTEIQNLRVETDPHLRQNIVKLNNEVHEVIKERENLHEILGLRNTEILNLKIQAVEDGKVAEDLRAELSHSTSDDVSYP